MLRALARPLVAACLTFVAPSFAQAQGAAADAARDWPSRTVRIIIPLGAGGGGDIFSRLLAEELQRRLGQTFLVENRTGGSLNIGGRACAESPPDGYTFCVLPSEVVVYNRHLFKSLPYNPDKDFEPINNLFFNVLILVANSKLGVKSIDELVALSKAKPGTLSYGTFSFPLVHFMEQLRRKSGADFVRVPFRSGGEVVNAVTAGTTPIAFLGLANMIPQVQGGMFTGLAVNANNRTPIAPHVPTLKEATGENYPPTWFGLFAPAGTPKAIRDRLHAEVVKITSDPAFKQKNFVDRAIEFAVGTTEEFEKYIAWNREFAAKIAKEGGFKPQ